MRHILIILSLISSLSCCNKVPTYNQQPTDSTQTEEACVTLVDTTYNLIVFKPIFHKVELEVNRMPSQNNDSVIFCAAAAFTSRLQHTFTYDNIVGAYITNGKHHFGYQGGKHYGRFVYADKHWDFIISVH